MGIFEAVVNSAIENVVLLLVILPTAIIFLAYIIYIVVKVIQELWK